MNVESDGNEINAEVSGEGPWLIFCHSLTCDLRMWDDQVARFEKQFSVLRYDIRGHGKSSSNAAFSDVARLADDLVSLVSALEIPEAHVVGLSLGGLIAQHFALAAPAWVRTLTLADTTSKYPDAMDRMWAERRDIALREGLASLEDQTLQRWFTPAFMCNRPGEVDRARAMMRQTSAQAYADCCTALALANTQEQLCDIRCPTLVVVGEKDLGTPYAFAEDLKSRIRGSVLEVIPDAAHLSNIEQPEYFNTTLERFISHHEHDNRR